MATDGSEMTSGILQWKHLSAFRKDKRLRQQIKSGRIGFEAIKLLSFDFIPIFRVISNFPENFSCREASRDNCKKPTASQFSCIHKCLLCSTDCTKSIEQKFRNCYIAR